MPGLRSRKIVCVGDSLAVTLPPDWLRWNRLKAGDTVELTFNGVVKIRPVGKGGGAANGDPSD